MTNDGYNGMVVGAFDGLPAEVKNNAIETATKIHRHLNKSAEEIINAGLEFIRMKEDLKGTRGAFGEWLEMYLPDLGQRAATKFMNVARKFGEGENGEFAVLKPSILYLLSAPGTAATDSEIESIIEANPPTAKAAQAELDKLRGEVTQKVEAAKAEGYSLGREEAATPSTESVTHDLSALAPEQQQEVLRAIRKPDSNTHVSKNSGNNEWYTPPEYIAAALATLGEIDLDPASSEIANRTVKASTYYTAEDDGLSREWRGRVFLNPPYAQPLISRFAEKICQSVADELIDEAIVLVNNATETNWFQNLARRASAICFTDKRIRFLDPEGNQGAPLQGQAILYFGGNVSAFAESHGEFGFVV